MYRTKKRLFIVIVAAVVVALSVSIFVLGCKRRQQVQILVEELPYRAHLEVFLEGSGLTSIRKEKDGLAYYELHNADGSLQGFVFLGDEVGYIGPIRMFVKTDTDGIIQRVHVWEHTETPIYVHPEKLIEFLDTFTAHRIDAELKWQTDIHGLTGATVTAESIIKEVRELGIMARGIYDVP